MFKMFEQLSSSIHWQVMVFSHMVKVTFCGTSFVIKIWVFEP